MGHPLGMAPSVEAPHPVGSSGRGFYPKLTGTFPAHVCPPNGRISFLRATALITYYNGHATRAKAMMFNHDF